MTNTKTVATFGEQMRVYRENAGLSLREAASELGIDTSLLAKIERNERRATKGHLKQMSLFFNIDEKHLIKEFLSDQFAYKIIEEELELDTFRVAEAKVVYYKTKTNL